MDNPEITFQNKSHRIQCQKPVLSGGGESREEFGFFSEHEDLKASIWDWHLT